MKITSFNPLIITKNPEEVASLFEALGFEKKHAPTGTSASGNQFADYRMKDANGFHVDVTTTSGQIPQDLTSIRMNVDDFEEAYKLLSDHGFKSANGKPATETESAKAMLMVSPSGFGISIIQHIKK